MARISDGLQEGRKGVDDLGGAYARDERETSRHLVRVERLAQGKHFVGGRRRADLATQRVVDAPQELDVGTVELSGAVADPEHVGRAVVPASGERVAAGEGLLIAEQERLVAREEVDLAELGQALGGDATGPHELHGPVDLRRQVLIALSCGAGGDELAVPLVDPREVRETALGEGA